MKNYLNLLEKIKGEGISRDDRTGVGTYSLFGEQLKFDISGYFPLVTTKKVHLKSIIYELLWFLRGDTNIKYLNSHGVHIWDSWADKNGELGPVYGKQWRNCNGIDQITQVIDQIKTNPNSRRIILNSWNLAEIDEMAIPPCPVLAQFYVNGDELSCHVYQRSADAFLGVPFDIAQYALLTMMIAQVCDLVTRNLIFSYGDIHIYKNHIDQVKKQLSREPKKLPFIMIRPDIKNIDRFKYEDFVLIDYEPCPGIKAPIAI